MIDRLIYPLLLFPRGLLVLHVTSEEVAQIQVCVANTDDRGVQIQVNFYSLL